ncbi:glycosyltransferase family 4 protein [Aurantibacillus circumpalustris]|uniref:glycosyltransferase family 4 protein n=1 Tax=Aurantibacillus circumpalustris TaxID=3036359 RepID=UPI00295B908D|nr:glycosyltransferase family 4 protein [Aurantibacillus circumpalustris]
MFKILQIANKAPYPANDGSSIAIYNMAKGFIENKVDLHLISINTKKHFKPDGDVPKKFAEESHYTTVYRNTNTSTFGAILNLFTSNSYFVSRFYFNAFEKKLIELLKSNSFDIIQIEGLFMGVYIDTIKKHSTAKIVLRAHNIEHNIWKRHIAHEKMSVKKLYLGIQNTRLKKFEMKVISKVDAIVPITRTDEAEFKNMGFVKPIYTCITGVDVQSYLTKGDLVEKAKTIFYFGSMDWLPNQEAANWFLDNCWDKVHKAVPEAKLIIAGRGMPLEFFHITRPNVLIIENVEDGKAFFQQHQIMIVPLWSGSGLRIKIIEGMAYGKAIVSTSIGAEGINYTNKKNILIADNATDFSNAVIKLLENQMVRKEIEKNATEFAKSEFDNFKVTSKLVEFYNQLLNA